MYKNILLAFGGIAAGICVAGGVFTVLLAVGLIPRFAGKTHTADKIFLYEEMVVAGTLAGNVLSVFAKPLIARFYGNGTEVFTWFIALRETLTGVFGIFAGIFVGCLAMAIAEMLDTIPVFSRRIGFRHGLGIAVLFMAIGKLLGSLFYFGNGFTE